MILKGIIIGFYFFTSMEASALEVADSIGVETVSGAQFIRHKVVSGEGWYSIARKYGVSYSEVRMANKNSGDNLSIGQIVLIPAKAKINDPRFQKNFTDEKTKDAITPKNESVSEKRPPSAKSVIHKVKSGETLFSISNQHSITVDQIKKWNGLSDNVIELGQELIVGIDNTLTNKVNPQSEKAPEKERQMEKIAVVKPEPEVKTAEVAVENSESSEKKESTVLIKTVAPDKKKAEEKKEEKKYSFANGRQEVKEEGIASWIEDDELNSNKYYALHRTAPIGTIIKVTNKGNNESVFVKVVGLLSPNSDNEGLIIKISKASADRLRVSEKTFESDLVYGLSSNSK